MGNFTVEGGHIDLDVNMGNFSMEETKMALKGLWNNKAAGLDETNPKLLKVSGQPLRLGKV